MAIKRQTKHKLSRGTGIVFCALIYAILFLPIVIVVANSFNGNTEKPYLSWGGFSLRWYVHLFQNGPLLASFGNTMLLAITTTVLATALGTLGAVGLYRYKFPGRNLIDSLLYIPVVIPEIVMGISLLLVYVRVGVPRGMVGLIIAHVTFCVSFVIFNVRARLDGYDPSLEEASMDLGANRLVTFFKVTLPMLAPGIAGGALLSFTLSIDDVVVSYFVYGQDLTFPLKVMQSIKGGVVPDVNALSTLILLGTVAIVVITQSGMIDKWRERRAAAKLSQERGRKDMSDFDVMEAFHRQQISRRQFLRGALGLAAAGLAAGAAGGLTGCGKSDNPNELNIFIWTEYVPDSVLEGFEKETGIHINQYLYSSNEDMLAKVRTENEGTYDILQPTDYMVKSLIAQELLEPLDLSVLTNKDNIGSQYMDQEFDPGNKYSIPFMGSATAIAYNEDEVDKPESFTDMLDEKFISNIVTLNDFREVLAVAGMTVGLTGNEEDDESIAKIAEQAAKFKPNFKLYDSDSPRNALVSGDCIAGIIWTAEIALAQRDNPAIQVSFPSEGCGIGTDNWCIPKGAKHYDNALAFINYMLRPEVAKVVSEDYPYVQPNVEAIKLLDEDFQNNPVENVPSDVFKHGRRTEALPPKVLRKYDKIWTNLKG